MVGDGALRRRLNRYRGMLRFNTTPPSANHDPHALSNALIQGARTAALCACCPHNIDDISKKIHAEPKGPNKKDSPKNSKDWGDSAYDALGRDRFSDNEYWDLGDALYLLEGYNGWKPRQVHKVQTP